MIEENELKQACETFKESLIKIGQTYGKVQVQISENLEPKSYKNWITEPLKGKKENQTSNETRNFSRIDTNRGILTCYSFTY